MAEPELASRSDGVSLHEEQLRGRTQQVFFSPEEEENFLYPSAFPVEFDKSATLDVGQLSTNEINLKIRELMREGYGHIVILNPRAKHSVGTGILNRLRLEIRGSLGYFGLGLIDGPNVTVSGRVGWSCGENMLAGTIVIEKNAGSCFGAALRGGDLVCKGDVGARTGIDQKGGSIIVGGRAGAFSGFMMQRGRMVILGDAGRNLGDSMYDGTIYVGGKIASLGVDAADGEMNDLDVSWLTRKLKYYGLQPPEGGVGKMTKIVSGKQLWNYDDLEPSEKKLIL